ncbi:capsule biosynthesis GfcC family protein [Shewanella decolorationis]|uniref:capsule biosynthesis GfcC family protein n=1 Tax=Shewanella decolorationis TaxID=256839 RepID=UPI001056EB3C|nr:capsule biosynthesis GfcC family protein [Shewanella decolorationis]
MRSYITPLALLVSSLFLPNVEANTQLSVSTSASNPPQLQITYPSAIRVGQAVQDGLTQLPLYNQVTKNEAIPIYWLGAALLDTKNTAALEVTRQQVLQQLATMGEQADNANYIANLAKFAQFLRNVKIGQRVNQPLDLDLIRITDAYNPVIDGDFLLVLPPRPTTITVVGAVAQTGEQVWQSRASSKDYLTRAGLLDNAGDSFVWIIQPDGKVIKQPIAYWNHQAQDIAPGAILFVEFSALFNDHAKLNNNIIELLKNRAL